MNFGLIEMFQFKFKTDFICRYSKDKLQIEFK